MSQQIAFSGFRDPKELVRWMGAIQAQDFLMSKWAIGSRLPGSTETMIEDAYNRGEIIRTHLMRPTWHLVAEEDVYWILHLTAPHVRTAFNSNNNRLELTSDIFLKSNNLLEKILSMGENLTRDELIPAFDAHSIPTNENRLSHLLMAAELDKIICSGPLKNGKLTYCLFSKRINTRTEYSREEAVAELALRYFASHSPATLKDFVWWSGLPITAARNGLESIRKDLSAEILNGETYWFANNNGKEITDDSVYLLPAFDEYLIAYRDRTAAITLTNHKKAISENGIFKPIVVINGSIAGIWKRTVKGKKVLIEVELFLPVNESVVSRIEIEATKYGEFLGKVSEIDCVEK